MLQAVLQVLSNWNLQDVFSNSLEGKEAGVLFSPKQVLQSWVGCSFSLISYTTQNKHGYCASVVEASNFYLSITLPPPQRTEACPVWLQRISRHTSTIWSPHVPAATKISTLHWTIIRRLLVVVSKVVVVSTSIIAWIINTRIDMSGWATMSTEFSLLHN